MLIFTESCALSACVFNILKDGGGGTHEHGAAPHGLKFTPGKCPGDWADSRPAALFTEPSLNLKERLTDRSTLVFQI